MSDDPWNPTPKPPITDIRDELWVPPPPPSLIIGKGLADRMIRDLGEEKAQEYFDHYNVIVVQPLVHVPPGDIEAAAQWILDAGSDYDEDGNAKYFDQGDNDLSFLWADESE